MYQPKNKHQIVLTTDWHFGHKNMEKLCYRPFGFEALISGHLLNVLSWLQLNGNEITVINLGDVCWSKDSRGVVKLLNEKIAQYAKEVILIKGNHDKLTNNQYLNLGFTKVCKFEVDGSISPVFLSHRPTDTPNMTAVFGHLHQNLPTNPKGILISQELLDYRPITLEEVLEIGTTPKWSEEKKGFISAYD